MTEQLLSTADAVCVLGVSPKTLYRLRKSGRLRFLRVGRQIRYTEAQIQALLDDGIAA